MRRTLCAAACVAVTGLSAPATASGDVLDVYSELALRKLSPAPLVPTDVPRSLTPLDRTVTTFGSRRRSGYGLRLFREGARTDAVIVLEGGSFKSVKAALRDAKRLGFTKRRTRVRGRRGHLLTRRLGPTQWLLLWTEGGRVYTLGTGTPRKVSLAQLRDTAAGLQSLGRDYLGTHADPDNSSEGFAVTTKRTVTTRVSWEAQCVAPGGAYTEIRVGNARATLVPRQGNAFSYDVAQYQYDSSAWSGTVSGTISSTAIALTIRATATINGLACDSGVLSIALDRRSDGSR